MRNSIETENIKPTSFPFLLGLFLIALSVRLYYLIELSSVPFFDTVLDSFDHYNFDLGAQSFAQGDWLAQSPNNSYSPLYKYFLGAIYFVFGRNFYWVYGIQFALGALGAVLLFLIGEKLFDRRVGVLAFVGFAFYSTEIIYEGIILRAAFITFLAIASFYLLLWLKESPAPSRLVVTALVLSLFFQSRPNTLLCLPFIILFLKNDVFDKWDAVERMKGWGYFLMPLFLSFIPLLVQCYLIHGRFVLFDASGPTAFLGGNFIGYPGAGFESSLLLDFQKENGLENLSVVSFIFQQITTEPLAFLLMYLRKIFFFFNDLEVASNISTYLYLESSSLLPYLFSHFSLFSSLGLIGLVLALCNKEKVFLLYSFLVAMFLSVIIFHVVARFRIPFVPFMILFAAYAVSKIISWIERKSFKNAGLAVIVFSLLLYGFRIPENNPGARYVDYCNWSHSYLRLEKWFDLNKSEEYALGCYHSQKMFSLEQGSADLLLMNIYMVYAHHLISKDDKRAGEIIKNAILISPFDYEAYRMLAEFEKNRGNFDSAIRNLHLSIIANKNSPTALKELIKIYYARNEDSGRISAALKAVLPLEESPEKKKLVQEQIFQLNNKMMEKKDFVDRGLTVAAKYFSEENWQAAIEKYEEINVFNDSNIDALQKHGIAYENLNEKEKALSRYYDSLLINFNNENLYSDLGNYYFSKGEYALAALHWGIYLEMAGDSESYQTVKSHQKRLHFYLNTRKVEKLIPPLSSEENKILFRAFN